MAKRVFRRVKRDKKTGEPLKYVQGSRNPSAKAAEMKRTRKAYKEGRNINVAAVSRSRAAQNVKKTTKRKNKGRSA
tara:strand:- start:2276 stop:2503 length:228 start_codon:yes stop_codon:yes gene_type:complete